MSAATDSDTGRRRASTPLGADLGILFVRLIVGALFIGHGTGKLFGWFGQGGIQGTSKFFESVGYKPAHQLVIGAGIVEIAAGVLLIFGFLVPLAAAIIIGDMMNAAWVKSAHGFWTADQGFEYEFVLICVVLALAIAGPGALAIDRNREWFRNRLGGVLVAVVLGAASGIVMFMVRNT
jgi:putative oxidoreductase